MAYGKSQLRPMRSLEKIKPLQYPETKKIQQGKLGLEGADKNAQMDMGGMPSSGNFQSNAGEKSYPGGSAIGSKSSMKGEGGRDSKAAGTMDMGSAPRHSATKMPMKPGSSGGPNMGSLDTMTKLIFHPKGNMGSGKHVKQKSGPGFQDSGARGSPKKFSGVSK